MDKTDVPASPTHGPAGRAGQPQGRGLEVEDLVKAYPAGTTAGDGVSFTAAGGEIFGLLGPNGSGKTTTVRILVTLLHKTAGVARVGGFATDRQPDRVREVIGYAGQATGIDDDPTAHENLVLQGLLHGLPPPPGRRRDSTSCSSCSR